MEKDDKMTFIVMEKLYLYFDPVTTFTFVIILANYMGRPIVCSFLSHTNTLQFL
jgi:hypothetical protein